MAGELPKWEIVDREEVERNSNFFEFIKITRKLKVPGGWIYNTSTEARKYYEPMFLCRKK